MNSTSIPYETGSVVTEAEPGQAASAGGVGAAASTPPHPLLILSDFNANVLAGLLTNSDAAPAIRARSTGYGLFRQTLLDASAPAWESVGTTMVWARLEAVSESFARAMEFLPVRRDEVLAEVDAFCDQVLEAGRRAATTLVATWSLPADLRGYGMLEVRPGVGLRELLLHANLRLAERLGNHPGTFLLDSASWLAIESPADPKMWHLAKVPYTMPVFKRAARDIRAAVAGVAGAARKVVICDLDDTLWGGVVGDAGWENLRLGGHDATGEALADFQRALKALTRRGIILGIVSKNTESVALEAINAHPEMVLRSADFAGWRINWEDKAKNIVELMRELNLGLQSAVFLDDNPVERARIREALPEVLVPDLPQDKRLYAALLRSLDCFDSAAVSDEDRARAAYYRTERERRAAGSGMAPGSSLEEWLYTLEMRVRAEPLGPLNLQRAGQLLNKTNQMNLRTRRLADTELAAWAEADHRRLWTFRVEDRFGDSGLTGLASIEVTGEVAHVVDYVLSCRVMGRQVENAMVHVLVETARQMGAKTLLSELLPTPKNAPCLQFWQRSGFEAVGENAFARAVSEAYPRPDHIALTTESAP